MPNHIQSIIKLDTATSTNSFLIEQRLSGCETKVVYTLNQQGGRGSKGREWKSIRGDSLAVSYLFDIKNFPFSLGWLPLLVGRSLLELLESLGVKDIGVKWPNDIVFGDRKLAGILIEAVASNVFVIGIGLNLHSTIDRLPSPEATSLAMLGVRVEDPLSQIVRPFYETVDAISSGNSDLSFFQEDEDLRAYVKGKMSTIGCKVSYRDLAGTKRIGKVVDLGNDGSLIVEAEGVTERTHLYSSDDYHIEKV